MEGLEYGTTTMVIALEHWKKVRFPLMHGMNVDIYAKNTALRYLLQNHALLLHLCVFRNFVDVSLLSYLVVNNRILENKTR